MRVFVALLLTLPIIVFAAQSDPGASAKRLPDESYSHALKRVRQSLSPERDISGDRDTAVSKQVRVSQIDFSLVPAVASYEELLGLFKLIRDNRFLHAENNPEFLRRISWMYPDDGCFARAALTTMILDEQKLTRPAKIFAFGDLQVDTPYTFSGSVNWWYHVSTAVSYMGTVYVFDPAINAEAPLPVSDWYNRMGNEAELKGVVCNAYAYDPFDRCSKIDHPDDELALEDQLSYLYKEWRRIDALGFDPNDLLGDNPPWNVQIH